MGSISPGNQVHIGQTPSLQSLIKKNSKEKKTYTRKMKRQGKGRKDETKLQQASNLYKKMQATFICKDPKNKWDHSRNTQNPGSTERERQTETETDRQTERHRGRQRQERQRESFLTMNAFQENKVLCPLLPGVCKPEHPPASDAMEGLISAFSGCLI